MTLDQLLTSLITLLTRSGSNRVSASDILAACQNIVSFFSSQIASIIPDWDTSTTFNTDGSGGGKYSKYPDSTGKKRLYETLSDENVNHAPPSSGGSNSYWTEISQSSSAAIPEYAPGLFGPNLIIVYHNHNTAGRGLYILLEASRPFNSINIETEITGGKWQRLGGDGSALWGELTGTLTSQTDLVTYVAAQINAALEGLKWKTPGTRARTTAALPTNTVSGTNTILTASANGALPAQDGITFSVGQDLLVADEVTQSKNGVYTITQLGDGSTPWILTRRSDANTAGELEGAVVSVEEGTANGNTTWRQTTDSVTLGSSNIVWAAFGTATPAATALIAGILKAYAALGANSDGTMTQAAITAAMPYKGDQIACSDEVTPIAAGVAKVTFRARDTMVLSDVFADLTTAQATGSIFTVDINVNGSSILSTKLTIDNTETSSATAATAAVISSPNITVGDVITIDVDQVTAGGSSAVGLKIRMRGR